MNMSAGTDWGGYKVGGGTYHLTEADGTSYKIDPATGAIEAVSDQSGNTTTYTYANALGSAGTVTATDALGRTLFTVNTNASNEVTSVQIAGQNPITYGYTSGNLSSVVNQVSQQTTYSYAQAQFPTFLTGVTNNIGQPVLGAHYNASGLLDQLTNPSGVTIPVTYGDLANGEATQTVVDAAGNITTDVLNPQFGTLLRKIQTQTDSSGNVLDYIVSLSQFNYANDDAGVISSLRPSGVQVLQSVQNYWSFEIQGTDPTGLRFTQLPDPLSLASQTTYDTVNDPSNPAYQQVLSSSQGQDASGTLQTTLYSDYSVIDADRRTVKPLVTTVELQTPNVNEPTGYDSHVQSQTYDQYQNGKIEYSLNVVGRSFSASRDPHVGVFSDLGQGNYPTLLYATLTGFSVGADNATQNLTWNAAAFAYQWNDGSTLAVTLTDTSLQSRGSGLPLAGDGWTLAVSDAGWSSGQGIAGSVPGLAFDGTPAGLQALVNAFFAASAFTNQATQQPVQGSGGLGLAVPTWVASGTKYTYTPLSGTDSVVTQTQSVTATIGLDGSISNVQPVATQNQSTYYTNSTAPGALYGAVEYSFDAAGQETFYAYNSTGQTVLQYAYKQWTDPATGTLVDGWVGTTNVFDGAGRQTDTYQATYTDPNGTSGNIASQVYVLPVISDGNGGIEIDTNAADSPHVNVYAAPIDTAHTDYNALGQVADTVDQYGGQTTFTYDANGNKIQTQYPDGTVTRSVFDALNRAVWTTNQFLPGGPAAPILTHQIYDQLGHVTETDTFLGGTITIGAQQVGTGTVGTSTVSTSGGTLLSTNKSFYDAAGHTIETIAPSGLRSGTIYYPDGQAQYTGPLNASAPDGGRAVTTDAGNVTDAFTTGDFEADSYAHYTQTLYNQYDPTLGLFYTRSIDADGHPTATYTDAQGRTVRTVFADGSFTETLYGIGSSPVLTTQEGEAVPTPTNWQGIPSGGYEEVDLAQRKAGDPVVPTYKVYDAKGNLVDVYQPAVADMDPNSATYYPNYGRLVNPHWHYTYDVAGNELSETDPKGNLTTWTYDPNGNKLTHTLPGGQRESWTYDSYNRVVTHTDLDGNTAWEVYDDSPQWATPVGSLGRLIAEYRYNGPFAPPAAGTTTPGQTSWAERTVYVYDDGTTDPSTGYSLPQAERAGQGRVAEVQEWTNTNGTATETDFTHTTYDAATGQPDSIASSEGTINYAYDPATGSKMRMWTGTDPNAAPDDVGYGYDSQGRLANVFTFVLDGTRHSTYAGINTATHIPRWSGGTPPSTNYRHDPAGNVVMEQQTADGTQTAYAYDADERLTGVTTELQLYPQQPIFAESYTLYDNGLRKSATDTRYNSDGTVFSQTTTNWAYDDDQRLTSESLTVQAGGANAPAPYTDGFTFDQAGNRMEEDVSGTQSATVTYDYNSDNQLLTEARTGDGAYATTYGYDDAGNMTSQSRTGTNAETDDYTWDLRGRMLTATVGGVTTAYAYDTDGTRTSETTGTSPTTYYLNDPANPTGNAKPVEESTTRGGAPTRSYLLGMQVIAQADSTHGELFLVHDGHGSTRLLITTARSVVEQYDFDAFGGLVPSTADQSNAALALTPWLFAGDGAYDAGSGLTYQLARWRDGFRFTSMDPTAFAPGDLANANLFVYAGGDSINGDDPSGLLVGSVAEPLGAGGAEASDTVVAAQEEALGAGAEGQARAVSTLLTVLDAALAVGVSVGAGGLAYATGGGGPPLTDFPLNFPVSSYALQTQAQLQQSPIASGQAVQQAMQSATASGQYTTRQLLNMPKFYVYQSRTHDIYWNDLNAMAGNGTIGGVKATNGAMHGVNA